MWWTLFSFFVIIFVAIYQYLRSRNDVFKRLNVPGPPPTLILGNLKEFFGTPIALKIKEWTKKHGTTYGYYEGGKPILVTSNVDILHGIFIKQFSNFHSRKTFALQGNPDTDKNISLFTSRGLRWKRLRNISNPTFTAAKMKSMLPMITSSVQEFIDLLQEKSDAGQAFDIYPFFQGLTLDTIARVAFGYETSVQQDQNSEILKLCKTIFSAQRILGNPFTLVGTLFPEIAPIVLKIARTMATFRKIPGLVLTEELRKLVDLRRKHLEENRGRKHDFIQLMLEAESEETWDAEAKFNSAGNSALGKEELKELRVSRKLSSNEIVSQCLLFLLAGFETTSTALAFCTYLLAQNPHVQEKLQQELDQALPEEESIGYDSLTKIPYLDWVLKESLRLYPIASAVNAREATNSANYGELFIPGGMTVQADVWTIHYSTEMWGDDAAEFRPERFSPDEITDRHPCAFLPFGVGPRNCIGMRFALLEEKLAMAQILRRFDIVKSPETKLELQGNQTTGPKEVKIFLKRREKVEITHL